MGFGSEINEVIQALHNPINQFLAGISPLANSSWRFTSLRFSRLPHYLRALRSLAHIRMSVKHVPYEVPAMIQLPDNKYLNYFSSFLYKLSSAIQFLTFK